jgi:hypothetical protein
MLRTNDVHEILSGFIERVVNKRPSVPWDYKCRLQDVPKNAPVKLLGTRFKAWNCISEPGPGFLTL